MRELHAEDLGALAALPPAARRARLAELGPEAVAAHFASASLEALLLATKVAAARLTQYEATLVKSERIGGSLHKPQTLTLAVRTEPLRIALEVTDGPAKGRKVTYDAAVKPGQIHAKEAGLLGMAGAIWVAVDSPLARRDTHHPITDLSFPALIAFLSRCMAEAAAYGGYVRKDEGFDRAGRYIVGVSAPVGAGPLYATRARIGIDPAWMLPTLLEVEDAEGPLERFEFRVSGP